MTREEVLEYQKVVLRNLDTAAISLSTRTVADIIDCYESLLARCRPWLEIMREAATKAKLSKDKVKELAELDTLLAELETEVKHEK